MGLESILDDLSDFSFFGGVEPEALNAISDLFEEGSYAPGTCVIEQGTCGNRLYIITSGRTEVRLRADSSGEPGEESVIACLNRGDTFGEMELLDTQERSASVVAVETTATVELTNRGLYEIFLRRPDAFRMIIMNLGRDLSRRLREADRQLAAGRIGEPSG